jgi:polysaccharide export outer membrane protein
MSMKTARSVFLFFRQQTMQQFSIPTAVMLTLMTLSAGRSSAQTARPVPQGHPNAAGASGAAAAPAGVSLPADFVIGPEDVLGILFWREPDVSGDVTVRPDGKITLSLFGEVTAGGLTPEALRGELQKAAEHLLADANVTVVVKQINSRKVFITGQVAHPGAFPLTGPRTVMQLIALAGGLNEFADANSITIMRLEDGRQRSFPFHYKDVARGKLMGQNMQLQPGDTVVVP